MTSQDLSFGKIGPSDEKRKRKEYFDRREIAPYLLHRSIAGRDTAPGSIGRSKNAALGSSNASGEADAAAGTSSVLQRVSSLGILRASPTPQRSIEPPKQEPPTVDPPRDEAAAVKPTWRLRARLRTTGVGMIMSLNVGTDPPDVTKPHPCARLQCWMDPTSTSRSTAKDAIGERLQAQYSQWQPQRAPQSVKVKYKHAPDPTVDDVRTMCSMLRRQARHERVLLHYNGHGVPRPTPSGEIWVFDTGHTQYIPLCATDLRQWVGKPSIMVLDCSSAGILIPFLTAPLEDSNNGGTPVSTPPHSTTPSRSTSPFSGPDMEASSEQIIRDTIVLCASSEGDLLPMHPEYPADIFTSCLTTPLKIALRYFIRRNPHSMGTLSPDVVDYIPGTRGDRKTPLGELNWIFAAVTDCIAWNVLPKSLFQRLFRQDHMLAGIFRNFLLADRIMRTLGCTPQSFPALPSGTHVHPLWEAWDLACETCLIGLVRDGLIGNHQLSPVGLMPPDSDRKEEALDGSVAPASNAASAPTGPASNLSSPFFSEQLIAFEVWLKFAAINEISPSDFHSEDSHDAPEQLPILLQALLSPAHRVRALNLLRRFLALGPWAVNVALCLGTLPYVLKLLQSTEYKRDLVGIWTSILNFDPSIQDDLVRDNVLSHFVNHLTWGLNTTGVGNAMSTTTMEEGGHQRSMAAFILAATCLGYSHGQNECIRYNLHGTCCSLLSSIEFNEGSELEPGYDAKKSISEQRIPPRFRMWLCICLGNLVKANTVVQGEAYGVGVHRRLFARTDDDSHDVRAAACYALGCLTGPMDMSRDPRAGQQATASPVAVSVVASGGAVLPTALIPTRLVGLPHHQGQGRPVTPVASGGIPRQFQPTFMSGHAPGPSSLQWRPQHIPIGTGVQVQSAGMTSRLNLPGTAANLGSGMHFGGLPFDNIPLVLSVFQDAERLKLDLEVAEVLLKTIKDATPVVRYECTTSLSCIIEKYLAVFLAVADDSAIVGDPSLPENTSADATSDMDVRKGRIPLPSAVQAEDLSKFVDIWQAIRASQHHDPHPAVSLAANAIVSVVHEHILNIKMEITKTNTKDKSDAFRRILSDAQIGRLDEGTTVEDLDVSPRLVAGFSGLAPQSPDEQAPLRRISSDYQVTTGGATDYRLPDSDRDHRSRDVMSILSDTLRSKMDYDFPKSQFYAWKKSSFAETCSTEHVDPKGMDPLSPNGAAESYREQRNRKAHEYSKRISNHYASLAPEPPRLKRHRLDFIEPEDEETKRQANEDMTEKKRELEFKQTGLLRESDSSISTLLRFHAYENALVSCDVEGGVSLWDYHNMSSHLFFHNGNPKGTRMTSGSWINETSNSLFMIGSEDGSVRIWDGFLERDGRVATSTPSLSTSFVAVPDMLVNDRLSGLILEWQQYSGRLIAGGNSDAIWCWDLAVDKPTTVLKTGRTACVTSLDTAWDTDTEGNTDSFSHVNSPDIIVTGQSDGIVKLFDLRANVTAATLGTGRLPQRRRMQYDEHRNWIVDASYTTYGGRNEIVSGSIDGVIKVWDMRVSASLRTYNVQRSALTMLTVHRKLPILATGSSAQFIKVVSHDGDTLQTITDLGHRVGPVTGLAFHPFKPVLAAADQEMVISLYTPKNPRWRT